MSSYKADTRKHGRLLLVLVLSIVVSSIALGCAIRLVSNYDEVTDNTATQLQKEFDTFLVNMSEKAGTPDGTYEKNKDFYNKMDVELNSFKTRAEAINNATNGKNAETVEQIQTIIDNLAILRELHRGQGEKGLPGVLSEVPRLKINQQFLAILTLEQAKKRGESK